MTTVLHLVRSGGVLTRGLPVHQEEHKQEMEEVLVAQVLPGLSAIMAMNDSLKTSMESHRTLATQVRDSPWEQGRRIKLATPMTHIRPHLG